VSIHEILGRSPRLWKGRPCHFGPHSARDPAGRQVAREVEASILDAGRRLADAGWTVEEIDDTPPLNESAEVQEWLWLADGFAQLGDAAARDGDPGALAVVAFARPRTKTYPPTP
jgi:amidase